MANELLFRDLSAKQLENKCLVGGTADTTHWITLPANTTDNLAALPRRVGSIAYDTTLNTLVVDNGSGFVSISSSEAPSGFGAASGVTVSAVENGNSIIQKTVLTLVDTPVTLSSGGASAVAITGGDAPMVDNNNIVSIKPDDTMPSSMALDLSDPSVIKIVMPATSAAGQADMVVFQSAAGIWFFLWLDIDNNGTGPSPSGSWYTAPDASDIYIRVPIVTGASALDNCQALLDALDASSDWASASMGATIESAAGANYGGVKLYDFPTGVILSLGATANLSFDWSGSTVDPTGSGDFSLGTAVTEDATLINSDINLLPSTAMLDPFVGGVGTGVGVSTTTASFDGTSVAKDVYLNLIVDAPDAGAGDVLVSGSVAITWMNLSDY